MSDVTYTRGGRTARPLPPRLLDPQAWDIPDAASLVTLLGDAARPRAAFADWGAALVARYDLARTIGDIGELDRAAERVRRTFRGGAVVARQHERREMLAPFVAAHLTMRQIADYCDLTVAEVVRTLFNGRAVPRADLYCDLEEQLRAGVLTTVSRTQLAARYKVPAVTLNRLIALTQVEVPVRKGGGSRRSA